MDCRKNALWCSALLSSLRERIGRGAAVGRRAAQTSDIEAGTLEGGEQSLFGAAEKIETLEVSAFDRTGLGEAVERPDASREFVQTGEVFQVTAIAA